ncbi:hypothetical protein [Thermosulfurimonas sp.]|uniref:hypothetical protein n=1 Tax=Thermosulfurimonas sp. TaxID=2080236 RepID=UPI0025E2EEA3|nr:hypothetical protein [Thermosulfurimonas sp.]
MRRSDFVFRAFFDDGSERLVLLEFLSYWKPWIPIRTLECRCRHLLQEDLPVVSVILLLTPAKGARDFYTDEEVHYHYRLVKLYELEAREVLERGPECLFPFVPLMKGGESLFEEAEKRIYEGNYSREEKADLLTGMAILGGLISEEIPVKLLERRRDLMIESAAYEIIKKEGYEEGMRQGIQQGIQRGLLEEAREMVLEALEERFGLLPRSIISRIKSIEEREILRTLLRLAIRVKDLEEFKSHLDRLEG